MPRRKSLVTVIRDMVREQVQDAIQGPPRRSRWPEEEGQEWAQTAASEAGTGKTAGSKTRMRRGPGRPPGSKNKKRRGPGRAAGSKNKAS